MKNILALVLLIAGSLSCFCQISLIPYGSFIRNLSRENRVNTYGAGIRLEFAKNDAELTKYLGIAYVFPVYQTEQLEARAYSNFTNPSYKNVTARYKRPMFRLEAGGNYYLSSDGQNFRGFNWYLTGGVEAVYIGNEADYSYYNKDLYTLGVMEDSGYNEDGSATYDLNLHLDLGTGIEKSFGPGNFFLQTLISLPVPVNSRTSSSAQVEYFVPVPFNINIGYKIPLGKR